MLRSQIPVIGKRHTRRFPPQCVHDAGKILAARKQILIEPDPSRMRADPLRVLVTAVQKVPLSKLLNYLNKSQL